MLPLLLAAAGPVSVQGDCTRADRPALLVRVAGFANRQGAVRVRLFGPPTSSYFDKKRALVRIEVPVPRTGPVALCVPAPGPGVYAVDVRHDVNGDGKTDRSDGGGVSGNPKVSLLDVILKRRPDPARVSVTVGRGVVEVPVTLTYLSGGSFKPVR